MARLIALDIELQPIKTFLESVRNSAKKEYLKIAKMAKNGEFHHYDQEANAYFIPMQWEEIAFRSTLGELNALIEWELSSLAAKEFHKKRCNKRTMFDLRYNEIVQLIENHYKIRLDKIKYYNEIKKLRNKVNSFKHRKGYKHPFKDNCKEFPEKIKTSYDEAFESIKIVRKFFINLWKSTINRV